MIDRIVKAVMEYYGFTQEQADKIKEILDKMEIVKDEESGETTLTIKLK